MVFKCLTDEQRNDIGVFLLQHCNKHPTPAQGRMGEAARIWGVSRRTITTLWSRAREQRLKGARLNLKTFRHGNSNRKRIEPPLEQIKALPKSERTTIAQLAKALGVSVGLVHKWVKARLLRPHTNSIHPQLNEENKIERLIFCLNALFVQNCDNVIKFKNMHHIIHIDEKWFYLTKISEKYYIVEGEEVPHRSTQSKRFITKVMFMCAVSRPVFDDEGNVLFDGKIGIFPFSHLVPAQRNSKNRPKGKLETKAITSVNRGITKEMVISQIIPAIKEKWPPHLSKDIYIQQDNAKPHFKDNDPDFRAAASSDGFNIRLFNQPPNSPDLNVLDLGFFRSLQSMQNKMPARNVEKLIDVVLKAFQNYTPKILNYIFLSQQNVMIEICKRRGHNDFTTPHMGKEKLERIGQLPANLTVDEALVRDNIEFLKSKGKAQGIDRLMEDLGLD